MKNLLIADCGPVTSVVEPLRAGQNNGYFFMIEEPSWRRGDGLFKAIVAGSFVLFGGLGYYLNTHTPLPTVMEEKNLRAHQVSFVIEEKRVSVAPMELSRPVARVPVKKETVMQKSEPIDLTEKPLVGRHDEAPVEDNNSVATSKPVRQVYGLRRVYSTGFGAGGPASDAVIGKLGNTIAKSFDTLTATEKEIKGKVMSAALVTTAPSFRTKVVPEYTKEMLDNRVEGVVRVKVLVDIDGRVKKALPLNEIGHEAAHQALLATMAMEFNPAMRDNEPVAVWIVIPIRFEMVG